MALATMRLSDSCGVLFSIGKLLNDKCSTQQTHDMFANTLHYTWEALERQVAVAGPCDGHQATDELSRTGFSTAPWSRGS